MAKKPAKRQTDDPSVDPYSLGRSLHEPSPWAKLLISNAITLFASASIMWAALDSNESTEMAKVYEITVKRLESTEKRLSELQRELIAAQVEIITLKAQISEKVNALNVLERYMDNLPLPAWIKVREKDEDLFRMYSLNTAYVFEFCVSKTKYIGNTDYEVWPPELAKEFEANDKLVEASLGHIKTTEIIYHANCQGDAPSDEYHRLTVIKFAVNLPDGRIGIGGIVTNIEKIPNYPE